MTDDLVKQLRANASWGDARFAEAADRIEALTAERDKAYANGYSDAETEISTSALGQKNAFLHSQYANAADRIEALTAKCELLGQEVNMAKYGQPNFAWSIHTAAMSDLQAENARLRGALSAVVDEYEMQMHGPALHSIEAANAVLNIGKADK